MKFRVYGAATISNPNTVFPMIVVLRRDHYVQDISYEADVRVYADTNEDGVEDAAREIPDPIFDKRYAINPVDNAARWTTMVERRKGSGNLENWIRGRFQAQILTSVPAATFTDLDTDV